MNSFPNFEPAPCAVTLDDDDDDVLAQCYSDAVCAAGTFSGPERCVRLAYRSGNRGQKTCRESSGHHQGQGHHSLNKNLPFSMATFAQYGRLTLSACLPVTYYVRFPNMRQ